MIIEQMPPENCPEVSCVNWVECGGNVSTSKIRNAAELRMCPACGVPLVLTWDTGAECVRVWPASGQLASYLGRSWTKLTRRQVTTEASIPQETRCPVKVENAEDRLRRQRANAVQLEMLDD